MSDSTIARLKAAIDARTAVDRSGWTGAQRSAELIELFELRKQLNALIRRETGEDRGRSKAR